MVSKYGTLTLSDEKQPFIMLLVFMGQNLDNA